MVGYGLSGKAFHAPFLHVHEGFNLKKVIERNTSESLKNYPYTEVVRDIDAAIADEDIKLVVICTPNVCHFEQVKKCIEAGKNVVVEKPFMNSSHECDEIIKLAKEKNVHVFVYHNRRWDGDFKTIRKIVRTGVLGNLQYYEAHFDRYSPERKRAAWRDEELPGSGILFDLGPHLIDQALVLFGLPDTIQADIQNQRNGSQVDDYFWIKLGYQGLDAVLTAGMLVEDHNLRYLLHGTNGSFIKYGIDPQEALLRNGLMPVGDTWGKEDPSNYGLITLDDEFEDYDGHIETAPGNYMDFYNNVFDVMNGTAEEAVKPADARNVIRLIELAVESNRQKTKLKVEL